MKKTILALSVALSLTSASAMTFDLNDCSAYFSPHGGVTDALVKYIDTAKSSVRVLAYNFTSKPVAQALIDAHKRGVDVQIVLDKSVPTERDSALPDLLAAGVVSYIDKAHRIAHNKTILVDGEWIETGSFNYSPNAENFNGENALICHGVEAYAQYNADWEKHKAHSTLTEVTSK
jgi:phosphatidylserine/phosphatidylglycerophosphate/cardiolipin synthase-like enzyme